MPSARPRTLIRLYSMSPNTAIIRGAATAKAIRGVNPEPALVGTGVVEPVGEAVTAPDSVATAVAVPVPEAVGATEDELPLDFCESWY